jgi:hypothetical protein
MSTWSQVLVTMPLRKSAHHRDANRCEAETFVKSSGTDVVPRNTECNADNRSGPQDAVRNSLE